MITLAKFNEVNEQQIFNQVVAHLRKQGVQSINGKGVCAYRGAGGKMCAAGCLIGDDEYTPLMDDNGNGLDWEVGVNRGIFPEEHAELIADLQSVHDSLEINWERGFKRIAEEHNLIYKPPAEDQ